MPPSFFRGSTVKLLVLILSVVFASPAFGGADADSGKSCSDAGITDFKTWMEGDCTVLCEAHTSSDACTPDEGVLVGYGRHRRIRSVSIELQESDCTAGDGKIYGRSKSAECSTPADCPWHYIGNLDLDATDDTGISLISIDGIAAAPLPYMKAVFSSAVCSSGATILVHRRGALQND